MAELIVRRAGQDARIGKPVTGMTLRHSYALHCLEAGANIRELQVTMGHACVETTLMYQKLLLPKDVSSPLDRLEVDNAAPSAAATCLAPCLMPLPALPLDSHPSSVLLQVSGLILHPFPACPLPFPSAAMLRAPYPMPLYPAPLSVKPFELPFQPEVSGWDKAAQFMRLLKTQLTHRFLAMRRGLSPPIPAG